MSRIEELIKEKCPNGVIFNKLKDICHFENGKGHEKNIVEDGKYIVVNSKFVSTEGKVIKRTDKQIVPLYKDDLLIVMSDLPNGKALAKIFIVDEDDKYSLNQRIGRLTIKDTNIMTPRFCYYIVNRNKQLLKYDDGTNQTNLRKDDILDITIPIPPLEVQEEIVNILDKFGELESTIKVELELRQSQYEYWSEKFFHPTNNIITKHITDIALIKARVGWQRLTKSEYLSSGNYYLITGTDFNAGQINFNTCVYVSKERYDMDSNIQVHKDDILITKDGTLGKVAFLQDEPDKPTCLNSGVFRISIQDNDILPKYIYHYFNSKIFKDFVENVKTGSTIPHLTQQGLVTLNIPIPPLEEQERIVNILDKFDKLINDISEGLPAEIEARRKQYEYYRDKLLSFEELK